MKDGDEDFTVMRIRISGVEENKNVNIPIHFWIDIKMILFQWQEQLDLLVLQLLILFRK